MSFRQRDERWNQRLERRDDSDCDNDESDSCTSFTTPQTITSPTSTSSSISTPSNPKPVPPPLPSGGPPAPPSGGPLGPKPPQQTTTSTTSTASIASTISATKPQTSLLTSGVGIGILPTTTPIASQKQPVPTLEAAGSGISSVNESSAAAIKAASAIIAVESTVIIAALLLFFYKFYIRKREKKFLNGLTWAIGSTNRAHTPPSNDGSGGAGTGQVLVTPPPPIIMEGERGIWMGPGVVQAPIVSSQGQSPPQGANIVQHGGGEQPLGSNPPSIRTAASHAVENGNSFLDQNEKPLPEIHVQEQMHQVYAAPEVRIQPPSITSQDSVASGNASEGMKERPRIVNVRGHQCKPSTTVSNHQAQPQSQVQHQRGESELLQMEKELENLEREGEALERDKQGGRRNTFGRQAASVAGQHRVSMAHSLGSGGRGKSPGSWIADQKARQGNWGRFGGGV